MALIVFNRLELESNISKNPPVGLNSFPVVLYETVIVELVFTVCPKLFCGVIKSLMAKPKSLDTLVSCVTGLLGKPFRGSIKSNVVL